MAEKCLQGGWSSDKKGRAVKGRLLLKRSAVNPRYFAGGLHSHVILLSHSRSTVLSPPATYSRSELKKCLLVHRCFLAAN